MAIHIVTKKYRSSAEILAAAAPILGAETQLFEVYALIVKAGSRGRTRKEICNNGIHPYSVSARLKDLLDRGFIKTNGQYRISENRRGAVWVAVPLWF